MEHYYKIEEMLEDELEKIASQDKLTTSSLDVGDKVAHFLKSIKTIEAMDEAYDGNSYDDDMMRHSHARGRGTYAKRDSMGRYSRDYMSSSRDGMNKHRMMDEIEELKHKIEQMGE